MIVLSCQQIKKYYGANPVLENLTFEVAEGERVGLIGQNGCGKSTLLQILAGEQRPDEGLISIQKRTRIGYLPQVPVEREGMSVYEVLTLGCRELIACQEQMQELEARMSAGSAEAEMAELLQRYAEAQERFQRLGGYEMEAHIQQVANGVGVPAAHFSRPYGSLSGGEKTRVGLASLLIERPTLLLLDEPTNHLDAAGTEWLESFLSTYSGTALIVSHDRYFLDRVATKVIELEEGEASVYAANYTGYVREKEERLLRQFADYQEQQRLIRKMKETISQLQEWGRIGDNGKFFRRAASMQKALDRMERVKRPVLERRAAQFDLEQNDRSGRDVLKIAGLTKRYGARSVLNQVDAALAYGEKVALVGKNGAGKSTLFRLVLGQEQPDQGSATLGARVETGYLAQQDRPEDGRSVLQFFCEEALLATGEGRGRLARYLFYGSDVFKPVNQLSGGEWTRLRLALLVHRKPNLLLLDEPTNHLDIASREALEEALEEFPGTVLAISHDRYFINRIAGRVWELEEGALTSYPGDYDSYREERERRPALLAEARPPVLQAARRNRQAPGPKVETPEQTERAILALEELIGELDAELARAQEAADLAALADRWEERQRLQEQLDQLYGQWLERSRGEGEGLP